MAMNLRGGPERTGCPRKFYSMAISANIGPTKIFKLQNEYDNIKNKLSNFDRTCVFFFWKSLYIIYLLDKSFHPDFKNMKFTRVTFNILQHINKFIFSTKRAMKNIY